MLLVAQRGIDLPLRVEDPVESAELPVAHDPIEVFDALAGIRAIFVPVGRRVGGEGGRRPGHPRLVDQEPILVGYGGPVAGEVLVEAAEFAVERRGYHRPVSSARTRPSICSRSRRMSSMRGGSA